MATETTRAIVPDDDSWKFHEQPDHPFWNESGLFGFMIPERKIDGYFYIWHRPNMKLTSAGVALWDDIGSETHNCLYSEWFNFNPMPEDTDMFDFELGNGMRCELIEPLKRYRLAYESDELELDLLWEGAYPPPNLHYDKSAEQGFDVYGGLHYEQLGTARGTVTLRGEQLDVDCHHVRDYSRGLRPGPQRNVPGGGFDHGWASERSSFVVTTARPDPAAPVTARSLDRPAYGHFTKDGELGMVVDGEREVTEREPDGRPRRVKMRLEDERGRELLAEAEVVNCLKWHSLWHMQWCLAKWTIDGEEGWGECQDWFDIAVIRAHQRVNLPGLRVTDAAGAVALEPGSGADTLHGRAWPQSTWTTTNVGEAIPGVQTPLGWSVWGDAGEEALRRSFHKVGALDRSEMSVPPRPEDRLFSLFYGRIAVHLDLLCEWTDRVPGTDGEAMAKQLFTYVPAAYESRPQRRYYPRVVARAAIPWIQAPRLMRASRRRVQDVWERSLRSAPGLDAEGARRLLLTGAAEFRTVIYHHTLLTMGSVQPVYDLLERVTKESEISAQELMGGHGGHEETTLLVDLWECSRDRMTLERFLERQGFHGPREGDLSSAMWREDPVPVTRLIEGYRAKPEDADPLSVERAQIARRRQLEHRFLSALPRHRRPPARLALALGVRYIPLRGLGKVAYLQSIDIARAGARRLGEVKASEGELADPEDVFFLTVDDLKAGWPGGASELAAERRGFHERYLSLDLPEVWQGEPEPVASRPEVTGATRIEGIGASPGVVEGRAKVILDPAEAEVSEGEILIARNTDPAWASLMFLSAGLVSDIGGLMSHTAVVARELGIPCVVNTGSATRAIATGDRIRLDGTAGTVELIERDLAQATG